MRILFSLYVGVVAACSCMAAETPAQAAVAFAEGLRDRLSDEKLLERCALNPETGDRKKQQIMGAWRSYAASMLPMPFEIAEENVRDGYAAVVLTQHDKTFGGTDQVLSFAVIKRGDAWLAAPVMSSFQNSVVSYDPEILRQRQELEHWMLGKEILLREQFRSQSAQRLLEMMQQKIGAEQLKTIEAKELLRGLIAAIRARDPAGVLARLGGSSVEAVPDWDSIVRKISTVFSSGGLQKWPWCLLSDPQSLQAMSEPLDLGDEKTIDMLILHPASQSEEPDFLSFSIKVDEAGHARVVLPDVFWESKVSEDEMGQIMDYEDEEQLVLYDDIFHQARKSLEGLDLSRSIVLAELMENSLQNNHFVSFWGAGAAPAKKSLLAEMPAMIELWQKIQGSATGSSLFCRVGFLEHKDHALLVLQSYAPRNTNAIQLQKLWLERKDGQWKLLAETPTDPPEELETWWDENKKQWAAKLADPLVRDAVRIGGLAQSQPDPAKVREVFQSWLQAVEERSLKKVLPFCAAFQDDRSVEAMMRALAGELMYGSGRHEVLDVAVNGRWAAVSAKYLSDQPKSTVQFPLYVFVSTDQGPRMLSQVELKLGLSGNRSRNYLNNLAFTELKKYLPDAAVEELKKLYEKHTALVEQQSKSAP